MYDNENNIYDEEPKPEKHFEEPTEDSATDTPEQEQFSEAQKKDFDIIDEMPLVQEEDRYYSPTDTYVEYDPPAQPIKKPITAGKVWLIALAVAVITCLATVGTIYGVYRYMYKPAPITESTIIYRDGNDLRTRVDLTTALGIKETDKGMPLSVTEVANRIGPTVVGISAEGVTTAETMFGQARQPFASSGTGFIISTDGYIVTNHHVIADADKVIVTLDNDKEYEATIVGTDPKTDLAVLKIEEVGLTPAILGNSSDVQVGELAVAIGNPLGQTLSGTVTGGIISATNRKVTMDGIEYTLLQTDAAINSGNSGGPLANAYGEVIGINNAKIAASGVEGLGFAIPSDIAKPVIEDLIAVGYVRGRPLIGINGRNITEEMSNYYDLPIGVYVVSVVEFSAAEKAGLKIGDVITHCNGEKITTVDELNEIRDQHKAGDTLTLKLMRNEKEMEVLITLGEDRPSAALN